MLEAEVIPLILVTRLEIRHPWNQLVHFQKVKLGKLVPNLFYSQIPIATADMNFKAGLPKSPYLKYTVAFTVALRNNLFPFSSDFLTSES